MCAGKYLNIMISKYVETFKHPFQQEAEEKAPCSLDLQATCESVMSVNRTQGCISYLECPKVIIINDKWQQEFCRSVRNLDVGMKWEKRHGCPWRILNILHCASSVPCPLRDYSKAILWFISHLAHSIKSGVIQIKGGDGAVLPGPAVPLASRRHEWLVFHLLFGNKA